MIVTPLLRAVYECWVWPWHVLLVFARENRECAEMCEILEEGGGDVQKSRNESDFHSCSISFRLASDNCGVSRGHTRM